MGLSTILILQFMKKLLLFIVFTFAYQLSYAALSVQVDERSELLSIVCRLAEYKEYVNDNVKSYTEDIDSYFAPYVSLPLIDYAKEIRESNGIAYDAVSSLIPFMEIKNKKVLFTQDAFKEISEKDWRWSVNVLNKYAVLLDDFYKKTDFNRFFVKHSSLYKITKTRFDEVIRNQINLSWFDDTFGAQNTNFHIVLNLCNGTSNYGASDEKGNYFSINGADRVDSLGIPSFQADNQILRTIIHEFCHSYCNPICNKYVDEMLPVFDIIFPYVAKTLAKGAYSSSQALMYENLTRLATILYLSDNKRLSVSDVRRDEQRGFPWMEDLYFFYGNYRNNRDIYPDFVSFVPEYILFMKGIANQIDKVISAYENKIPRVVAVFPPNGSTVSSKIKEASILFNVPMILASGARDLDDDPENRKGFLRSKLPFEQSLSQNKRAISIQINLEENTKYGCILKTYFRSEEGYDATEEYEWKFDTKKTNID